MNKQQLIEKLWTPITRKLPPDEHLLNIVTYNSQNGYVFAWPSNMARKWAEELLAGPVANDDLSWDRRFTHWIKVFPPEGEQTYAEYVEKSANTKKRDRR